MPTEQDIIEYRNLVRKISNKEIPFEDAKEQCEKIAFAYSVIYSENLLGSEQKKNKEIKYVEGRNTEITR